MENCRGDLSVLWDAFARYHPNSIQTAETTRQRLGLCKHFKLAGGKQQVPYWALIVLSFRHRRIAILEISNGMWAYPPGEPNDPLVQAVFYRRPRDLD